MTSFPGDGRTGHPGGRVTAATPDRLLTIPNLLSLLRLALVPVFAVTLLDGRLLGALVWLLLAGTTDLVDGWWARRWRQQSRLGAVLDPVADKALVLTATLLLWRQGRVAAWFPLAFLVRDAGQLVWWATAGRRGAAVQPASLGKLATLLGLSTVALALLLPPGHRVTSQLSWLAVLCVAGSAVQYCARWKQSPRPRPSSRATG